jgi:hypothetical protein
MGAKVTGLEELSEDMRNAVKNSIPEAKKIVGKGSLNVKRDAQRIVKAISKRGYLPHYPRSIGYTVTASGTLVSSEIGPEDSKPQGGLGPIIENGSVNNPPYPHLSPALDAEENTFFGFMEELGESLLEGQKVTGPDIDPDP